jgi:hypothetical protein
MSLASATSAVPRAELVRQAVQGNPWVFIPNYAPMLGLPSRPMAGEASDELRVLLAHCYGRLGLRTPALELFGELTAPSRQQLGIAEALRAAERLPPDQISQQDRVSLCRANLDAIADRSMLPTDLEERFGAWAAAIDQSQAFRATSGSPVLRRRAADRWVWTHFCDQPSLAASMKPAQLTPGPLYVDGLHAPLAVRRIAELSPRTPLGLESPVTLLAGSDTELFDALSMLDLTGVLCLDRVQLIAGPDAVQRLESRLLASIDRSLGLMVALPSPPPTQGRFTKDDLGAMLQRVGREQISEQERLTATIASTYAGRDQAWWHARYAATDTDRPLRAIIPTTRFSSFLKHSAADMAEALRGMGWDARVLVEPDDRGNMSALGYAREIARFEPDLIVLLNATRSQFYGVLPPSIPVVTWLQDAMPHLFDEKVGAAMGPMDFLVGHPHRDLFEKFGFPTERVLHAPVVASTSKFSQSKAPASLLEKHACDVAYVSHHSQPPRELADRFIRESASGPNRWLAAFISSEYDAICAVGRRRTTDGFVDDELRRIVAEGVARSIGREPDPRQIALAHYAAARPLAERACRHEMLSWAAEICARRGWKFNLYGRGWESVPAFAAFARGEPSHDQELLASYQAARVHLHGGLTGYLHQRVIECALSGGLPLVRFNMDALAGLADQNAKRLTLDGVTPWICWTPDRSAWINGTDHPDCARIVGLQQVLGVPVVPGARHHAELLEPGARALRSQVLPREAIWLLGDFTQTTFDSAAGLERLIEAAIGSPRWRQQLTSGIAERARVSLTYDAVFRRALDMVRIELASASVHDASLTAREAA